MAEVDRKKPAALRKKGKPRPEDLPKLIPAGKEPDGTGIELDDEDEWHAYLHGKRKNPVP